MKYKSYKDSNVEMTTGLNAELLDKNDIISARSINRPIINILENQETDYNLLQTLLKTVYGNRNGIIPDIQEEFIPETFQIGSFLNSEGYYIRLPLGSMFLSKNPNDEFDINDENPFSAQGEYNYKDAYGKDSFLKDKLHSYIIENKPEINLYERQLASFIGLDLTYLDNDIKIHEDMIPFAIKVAIIDEDTQTIKTNSEGSPMYVQDENSNVIYLAKEGEGDLDIFKNNTIVNPENFGLETSYDILLNKNTDSLRRETILQYIDYDENIIVKDTPNGRYTSDINKAVVLKDSNGELKYRSGYYITVTRSTDADNEETNLPNLAENANFEVYLPSFSGSNTIVTARITKGDKTVEEFSFLAKEENDIQTINNLFYSEVYEKSKYFSIKKIQSKISNGDIIIGSKIIAKSSNISTNDYMLSITYKDENEVVADAIDAITEKKIKDIKINKKINQKYYDNIFDLTNGFLGNFSAFLTNINEIYKYVNFETIIKCPGAPGEYYIYYDLNGNIDNQENESYDKTGRFFIANTIINNPKYLKLFRIVFSISGAAPYPYKVTDVVSYCSNLDRRTISTKRAELSTLLVNSRTDLRNYFLLRDNDGNRTIELTENFDEPDKEQIRYASPITRITDKIETDKLNEPNENTWEDYNDGDTPSDFFEDAYFARNFITNEKYFKQHNDYSNKGIIIDRNKGLKIFNNSGIINYPFSFGDLDKRNPAKSLEIYQKYSEDFLDLDVDLVNDKIDEFKNEALRFSSYSEFQPLEIVSKVGNINIYSTDYSKTRINLSNLQDSWNNIIDLHGITRIRSRQDFPLTIRKISDPDYVADIAPIGFVTGFSNSKDDEDALNTNTNIFAGYIGYQTGFDKIENNRTFSVYITKPNSNGEFKDPTTGNKLNNQFLALSIRNTHELGNYFTADLNGDVVSKNDETGFLGYPIKSRTYFEENYIPYKKDIIDVEHLNIIDEQGTSTYRNSIEGRWLAAFIKYGYFGKITLADKTSDIINRDERDGVLRLGNSNIFDVSSIFINKNFGKINFDAAYDDEKENTIQSWYDYNDAAHTYEDHNGFWFILNRGLGYSLEPNHQKEEINNFAAAHISPVGTYINKNLFVSRQTFINNNERSSKEDNSSLVINGQTVALGEIIINKDYNNIVNDTSVDRITRNKDDKYKYYDFEFFNSDKDDGTKYNQRTYLENTKKYKYGNGHLFTFVNFGKTYLKGNVKIEGEFESKAIFNKTVKINNYRVANYKYNELTKNIPTGEPDYFESVDPNDKYYNDHSILPRNVTSLDVDSGTIIFGSQYSLQNPEKDASDFILNGSQYIRRRLEISEEDGILKNTKKLYGSLINTYTKKSSSNIIEASDPKDSEISPSLQVNGASHFCGDVVFGHKLLKDEEENAYYLPNKKIRTADSNYSPVKTIFWGANNSTSVIENSKDWKTDFDFHGKTWFDNIVKIGAKREENCYKDSNEDYAGYKENGSLYIFGKDNTGNNQYSLFIEGSSNFSKSKEFNIFSEDILLKAEEANSNNYSSVHLNGPDENFELETVNGAKTATFNKDKIEIKDSSGGVIDIKTLDDESNYSELILDNKDAYLRANNYISLTTDGTTSVKSGNNLITSKNDSFSSTISDSEDKVASIIEQTNKKISLETSVNNSDDSINLKTVKYSLSAISSNGSLGSIEETTVNKSTKAISIEEADSTFLNTSSNSWETNIKTSKTDTVPKAILGNSSNWLLTHGTSEEKISSSEIYLKTNNIEEILDNTNKKFSVEVGKKDPYSGTIDLTINSLNTSVKQETLFKVSNNSTNVGSISLKQDILSAKLYDGKTTFELGNDGSGNDFVKLFTPTNSLNFTKDKKTQLNSDSETIISSYKTDGEYKNKITLGDSSTSIEHSNSSLTLTPKIFTAKVEQTLANEYNTFVLQDSSTLTVGNSFALTANDDGKLAVDNKNALLTANNHGFITSEANKKIVTKIVNDDDNYISLNQSNLELKCGGKLQINSSLGATIKDDISIILNGGDDTTLSLGPNGDVLLKGGKKLDINSETGAIIKDTTSITLDGGGNKIVLDQDEMNLDSGIIKSKVSDLTFTGDTVNVSGINANNTFTGNCKFVSANFSIGTSKRTMIDVKDKVINFDPDTTISFGDNLKIINGKLYINGYEVSIS